MPIILSLLTRAAYVLLCGIYYHSFQKNKQENEHVMCQLAPSPRETQVMHDNNAKLWRKQTKTKCTHSIVDSHAVNPAYFT